METDEQRPALPQRPKRHEWYLVISAKGQELAVFHSRLVEAQDFAFEEGAGTVVVPVADRNAIPDNGATPFYVAEEREYMIRLDNGMDYGHFPDDYRCIKKARQLGPGTTVTRLGRSLRDTGVIIFTAE